MEKNVEKFVSDFLASHGRQALSDDTAEQVVGGGCIMDFGGFLVSNYEDADYLVYTMIAKVENAGFAKETIGAMLTKATIRAGCPSKDWECAYLAGGKDNLHNRICLLFDKGGNGF